MDPQVEAILLLVGTVISAVLLIWLVVFRDAFGRPRAARPRVSQNRRVVRMNAVHFVGQGGPNNLRVKRVPIPTIRSDELLIRVTAVGLCFLDTWRQQDILFECDLSKLGHECSGKVVAVGSSVTHNFKEGDEVCAIVHGGGGCAEYVRVCAGKVLQIPSTVSLVNAAALPRASCLAFYALSILTQVARGTKILIHGAGDGVGIIALQYAKYVGCQVFAVAETEEKLRNCQTLGAQVCINYKKEDFSKRVKAETGEKGVDIVLDVDDRDHFQKNLDCLAIGGSLVILGFKNENQINIDISVLVKKDINVIGGDLENLSSARIGSLFSEAGARFWPLIEGGHMRPVIGKVFRFSEAAEAHRALEKHSIPGKMFYDVKGLHRTSNFARMTHKSLSFQLLLDLICCFNISFYLFFEFFGIDFHKARPR
ncbi:uncharacterized protein [Henckelia pumila]|uniref:uncharacterized protein n=1 Tax=Henckelia pumila TaxID=405737 RepID=UPI003C6DFFFA